MSEQEKTPEQKIQEEADLKAQIDNLNKGIAKYRDEAKSAKDEIVNLRKEYDGKIAALSPKKIDEDDLPDVSKEDAKRLEKWAKAQGFVTKAEFDAKQIEMQRDNIKSIETQALDEFMKDHPEYEEDENWNKLKSEFSIYKQPTTLAEYKKVLGKVHNDLNPDDSKARAEAQAKGRLSLGGGSQKNNDNTTDEIAKLEKKYPNLTRDQIVSRVNELKSLFPDKK